MGAVLVADIPAGKLRDVLLSFANHAKPDGSNSFPKLTTIALEAGCSVSTVKRHRVTLENRGILVKTETGKNVGGRQNPNVYRVDLSTVPLKQGFTIDGPLVGGQESKSGGAGVHHGWTGQGSTSVPSVAYLTSLNVHKNYPLVEEEAEGQDQERTEGGDMDETLTPVEARALVESYDRERKAAAKQALPQGGSLTYPTGASTFAEHLTRLAEVEGGKDA